MKGHFISKLFNQIWQKGDKSLVYLYLSKVLQVLYCTFGDEALLAFWETVSSMEETPRLVLICISGQLKLLKEIKSQLRMNLRISWDLSSVHPVSLSSISEHSPSRSAAQNTADRSRSSPFLLSLNYLQSLDSCLSSLNHLYFEFLSSWLSCHILSHART
jgi:hypothetical protein